MSSTNTVGVLSALMDKKGSLLVSMDTETCGTPAAQHKVTLTTKSSLVAMVFQKLKDYDLYRKMIVKSAMKIEGNDAAKIKAFTPGEAWFTHDNSAFSIVSSKKNPEKKYLYFVPIRTKTIQYLVDGQVVGKEEYAKYLTPSKSKALLNEGPHTHKTGGFEHNVTIRTVGVDKIKRFKTRGITITQ